MLPRPRLRRTFTSQNTVTNLCSLDELDGETKELVISTSDATGLGVDIARVLLSFGLSVVFCDLTADGMWAYLVFHLKPSDDQVDWELLVQKLEATCPSDGDALAAMSHIAASENEPYVVKVSGFDRPGLLWRISRAFWMLDCSVFKAHVSTDADGQAVDSFWIHDNTGRLPSPGRALEISDHILELLGGNVDVFITPAPSQTQIVPKNVTAAFGSGFTFFEGDRLRRLACKDATSHSNLRSLVIKNHVAQKHWSSSDSLSSSRSGSMEDLLAIGAGGSMAGSIGRMAATNRFEKSDGAPGKGYDMSNNTAGDTSSSSRHRRVSSILMETPEKRTDMSSVHEDEDEGVWSQTGQKGHLQSGNDFGSKNEGIRMLTEPDPFMPLNLSPAYQCSPLGSATANNAMVEHITPKDTPGAPLFHQVSGTSITREFDSLEAVSIEADMHTSPEYILLTVKCHDRKGILYDIFVQLKEIRVRVANCRTSTLDDGRVRIEMMVQDAYGGEVCSAGEENDSANILVERMREAIAKPVTIVLGRGKRVGQYRLMVVAMVDAGGRGRPRVTYDVTKLFSSLGLSITECEVFVEEGSLDEDESFEVHKYVFEPNAKDVKLTKIDMQTLTDAVTRSLQGHKFECCALDEFEKEPSPRNLSGGTAASDAFPIKNAASRSPDTWLRLIT